MPQVRPRLFEYSSVARSSRSVVTIRHARERYEPARTRTRPRISTRDGLPGQIRRLLEHRLGAVEVVEVVSRHPVHGERPGKLGLVVEFAPHVVGARKCLLGEDGVPGQHRQPAHRRQRHRSTGGRGRLARGQEIGRPPEALRDIPAGIPVEREVAADEEGLLYLVAGSQTPTECLAQVESLPVQLVEQRRERGVATVSSTPEASDRRQAM